MHWRDKQATFEDLLDRNRGRFAAIARAYADSDLDDLLQEILLQIWRIDSWLSVAENAKSTYQKLLQDRIATPLGMPDCTVDLTDEQKKRFAPPHNKVSSPTLAWMFADLPGAGGVHANMRDLMRFAKAQLNPPKDKLGEVIELAWKQHIPADASGPAMGLGWMIHADGETRWHNGGTGGSRSVILINRQIKTAIIVLCNTAVNDEADELAAKLMLEVVVRKAANKPKEKPNGELTEQQIKELKIDADLRSRLTGRYQLAPNFIFDVKDQNGQLMVGITNQETQEVFSDTATRWSYRGLDATLEFHLKSKGPAIALTLHQNGAAQRAKRIGK